jgi:hypothetical protein
MEVERLLPDRGVRRYTRSDLPEFAVDVSEELAGDRRIDIDQLAWRQFDDELERRRNINEHNLIENLRTGERFNIETSWIQTDDEGS